MMKIVAIARATKPIKDTLLYYWGEWKSEVSSSPALKTSHQEELKEAKDKLGRAGTGIEKSQLVFKEEIRALRENNSQRLDSQYQTDITLSEALILMQPRFGYYREFSPYSIMRVWTRKWNMNVATNLYDWAKTIVMSEANYKASLMTERQSGSDRTCHPTRSIPWNYV